MDRVDQVSGLSVAKHSSETDHAQVAHADRRGLRKPSQNDCNDRGGLVYHWPLLAMDRFTVRDASQERKKITSPLHSNCIGDARNYAVDYIRQTANSTMFSPMFFS